MQSANMRISVCMLMFLHFVSANIDLKSHMSFNCSDTANGVAVGDMAFVCDPTAAVQQCFPYMETYGTGPNCQIGECDNFADEECQEGYIKCDKCKCVLDRSACWDTYVVCPGGGFNSFACKDGNGCIPWEWVTDGYPDCDDESDENECDFPDKHPRCTEGMTCVELSLPDDYTCTCGGPGYHTMPDGRCVYEIDWRISQCSNMNMTAPGPTVSIQCGNGTCVPFTKFRDCHVDCDDGMDEACYPGQVKCDDCKCVAPADAKYQCLDQTLNKLCLMDQTPYDYNIYHCRDGTCILWEWLEDNDPDCADDEDEKCVLEPCVEHAYCARTLDDPKKMYSCVCEEGYVWTGYSCEIPTTTSTTTTSTTTTSTTTTTPTTTTTTTPTTTTTTTPTTTTTTTPTTTTTTTPTTTTSTTTTTTTPTTTTTTTPTTTTTTTPTTTTTTPTTTTTTTPTTTTTTPTTTTTTTTPTTTTTTTPTTTTTTTPTTTTTTTPTTTTTTTPTTTTTTPTTTTTTTTPTTTTTTTPTTTTTTTPTTTTTTTPTTTTTTPTTTTTTTPTTTTTTTPTTTTTTPTATTEDSGNLFDLRTTLGVLFDGTAGSKPFESNFKNLVSTLVNRVEMNWPGRFRNYLIGNFDDNGGSVCDEFAYTKPAPYLAAVELWEPLTSNSKPCPARPILTTLSDALSKSATGCYQIIYTSGPASDYTPELYDRVMQQIMETKCQVDVVAFADGEKCFEQAVATPGVDPMKTIIDLATVSSGNVFNVTQTDPTAAKAELDQMFDLIGVQAESIRYILDAGAWLSPGEHIRSIPVDVDTKNITVSLTACPGAKIEIRDNRGVWLSSENLNWRQTVSTENNQAVTIVDIMGMTSEVCESGAGYWVVKVTGESCQLHYRVTGSGGSDFNYDFTFNDIDQTTYNLLPALGVASEVKVDRVQDPRMMDYFTDVVSLMLNDGSTRTISLFDHSTKFTMDSIQAPNDMFYVKVAGLDGRNGQWQRYSRTQLKTRPLDIRKNLMPVDCDQFHFNCGTPPAGTVVDNCIPIEKFRTGWPDCFSGLDEACTIGQYKCDGVCIPTTTNCTSADLLKLCHDLAPADAFKCKNGGCVPLAWLHDDENDCLDNSDDDPANLDECARGFQNCASGAECTNIPDSAFYCTCPEGQYGDGTVCQEDTGAIAQCPKASQTTSTAMTTTISDMNRVIKSIYYSRCMPAAPEIDCLDEAPTCMPFDKRLNGIVDCPGGVDEECMPGMTYCDKGKCVADDVADTQCLDRRVQASCEANNPAYFMCRNGTGCIIYQWAMDGVRDCADGSDEDPIIWNECLLGTDECDEHADCADAVNPPLTPDGRHTCTCKMSYTGDGKTCVPMA